MNSYPALPSKDVRDCAGAYAKEFGQLLVRKGACRAEFSYLIGYGIAQFCSRSSAQILPMRHSLEMCGVDARRHATEMIQLKAIWHRAVNQLVRPTVGEMMPAEVPITSIGLRTIPDPAFAHVPAIFEMPEVRSPGDEGHGSRPVTFSEAFVFALHPAISTIVFFVDRGWETAAALAVPVWNRLVGHAASLREVVLGGRGSPRPRPLHSIGVAA